MLAVFLTDPEEYRTARKMEQEKLSRMRAKHLVRHMDRQRRQSMEDIVLLIQKYYEELE